MKFLMLTDKNGEKFSINKDKILCIGKRYFWGNNHFLKRKDGQQ
jgi:hypothetical protein